MAYFLDLFSPETYEAFKRSDMSVTGFRETQHAAASKVKVGDRMICYLTKLSRWIGVLEVVGGPYTDDAPIFEEKEDPFKLRFRVKPLAFLDVQQAIPIREDRIWNALSFTQGLPKGTSAWTGKLRASLNPLTQADGELLEAAILAQGRNGEVYPVDEDEYRKLTTHRVRRLDKDVTVSVPEDTKEEEAAVAPPAAVRESIRIQALLTDIGARMGMRVWLPPGDRAAVLNEWKGDRQHVLERLPLNYDDATLRTVEQIDVLWLRGRSIARAFEVEHTTSVYSGILRMADLLALQPNMDIKLHIVAPAERREKVFQELRRPVFSLLDRKPLHERCTFLSYDSLRELGKQRHLAHLSDSVLDEYEEPAE